MNTDTIENESLSQISSIGFTNPLKSVMNMVKNKINKIINPEKMLEFSLKHKSELEQINPELLTFGIKFPNINSTGVGVRD
jgi:hypothetical protein